MLFWLEFHQNTTKIPSKYHPNSRKYHKNSIKIPLKFHKNSGSFRQKWVVFHRNNSGKHAVNLDKIGGSIPMVFQWNSVKIPLWFQMFTSGMPAEFLRNTALKFQHFFWRVDFTNSFTRFLIVSICSKQIFLLNSTEQISRSAWLGLLWHLPILYVSVFMEFSVRGFSQSEILLLKPI